MSKLSQLLHSFPLPHECPIVDLPTFCFICPKSVLPHVLRSKPSSVCEADRVQSRWMSFRLFSKSVRHFLTCCSLTAPSPYTSTNRRWISMADKCFAHRNQITLQTSYMEKVSNAIEHQLIPWTGCDWLLRQLFRVTPTIRSTLCPKLQCLINREFTAQKTIDLLIAHPSHRNMSYILYRHGWFRFISLSLEKAVSRRLLHYLQTTRFVRDFKLKYSVKIFLPHFSLFLSIWAQKSEMFSGIDKRITLSWADRKQNRFQGNISLHFLGCTEKLIHLQA